MRSKRKKFKENAKNPWVIEPLKPLYQKIRGQWNTLQFEKSGPIILELGCGKGEYSIALAEKMPEYNFVGVDIKGYRIWKGAQYAWQNKLQNVAFLRTDISLLDSFFSEQEVEEIYIPFPDPYPKKRDAKKRLVSPYFLSLYKKVLKPHGLLHLKTDSDILFDYALLSVKEASGDLIMQTDDFYSLGFSTPLHGIQTAFEKAFLEEKRKIKYLQASFPCQERKDG